MVQTLARIKQVGKHFEIIIDLEQALKSVPTLCMLTIDADSLKKKGQRILRRLGGATKLKSFIQLQPTLSRVGGGAMPEHALNSWALTLQPGDISASALERWFRALPVPLILRIEDDKMIVDLRTILEEDIPLLIDIMKIYLQKGQSNNMMSVKDLSTSIFFDFQESSDRLFMTIFQP